MNRKADAQRCAVYSITHDPTGRLYIGASLNVAARWKQHRTLLEAGRHPNAGLQEAWAASGPDSFAFAVLEEVPNLGELGTKEAAWAAKLEAHKTGFNVGPCSHPSARAEIFPPEIRAQVQARLDQKHMTRADLARAIGKTPQTVTRALNGNEGGGTVPPLWAAILEALDLRLTVEATSGEEGKP